MRRSQRPTLLPYTTLVRSPIPNAIIFFFNDTATTEIYTLSLHDALPIFRRAPGTGLMAGAGGRARRGSAGDPAPLAARSEEHTSELQSQSNLVCRLLLEKKKYLPQKIGSALFCSPVSVASHMPSSTCRER